MRKLATGLGAPLGDLLGTPTMRPDSIEAARLLSTISPQVREPIVEVLRALAAWAGRPAGAGSDS